MRDRFKNEIGKSQKCRQQKVGSPLAAPPTLPSPATTVSGFWFLPDPAGYHSVMGGRAGTCVYTHTHTQTLCRHRKWPLGLRRGGGRPLPSDHESI